MGKLPFFVCATAVVNAADTFVPPVASFSALLLGSVAFPLINAKET